MRLCQKCQVMIFPVQIGFHVAFLLGAPLCVGWSHAAPHAHIRNLKFWSGLACIRTPNFVQYGHLVTQGCAKNAKLWLLLCILVFLVAYYQTLSSALVVVFHIFHLWCLLSQFSLVPWLLLCGVGAPKKPQILFHPSVPRKTQILFHSTTQVVPKILCCDFSFAYWSFLLCYWWALCHGLVVVV